jgi:hypothetical protein
MSVVQLPFMLLRKVLAAATSSSSSRSPCLPWLLALLTLVSAAKPPEVQAIFDNIHQKITCTSPCVSNANICTCVFPITADVNWGGYELQITRSNIHVAFQGEDDENGNSPKVDLQHLSHLISVYFPITGVTIRIVNLQIINGSPNDLQLDDGTGMNNKYGNGNKKAYGGAILMLCNHAC